MTLPGTLSTLRCNCVVAIVFDERVQGNVMWRKNEVLLAVRSQSVRQFYTLHLLQEKCLIGANSEGVVSAPKPRFLKVILPGGDR